jgi:hypothetical protein
VTDVIRLLVALAVAGLLGRAARPAWRNRRVATAVWRRIRPHHVVGSLGLLVVVAFVAFTLMTQVPGMDFGLGRLLGLHGNAVFAPVEEAAARAGAGTGSDRGTDTALLAGIVAFLLLLLALFPWLAYVEERTFREGLEDATLGQELWTALRFGLLHLVMLIPIGAALGVGLAGFAYGRLYRSAYRRAERQVTEQQGLFGIPVGVPAERRRLRAQAVMSSTVWHTTFNSLIVVVTIAALLLELT